MSDEFQNLPPRFLRGAAATAAGMLAGAASAARRGPADHRGAGLGDRYWAMVSTTRLTACRLSMKRRGPSQRGMADRDHHQFDQLYANSCAGWHDHAAGLCV